MTVVADVLNGAADLIERDRRRLTVGTIASLCRSADEYNRVVAALPERLDGTQAETVAALRAAAERAL